MDKKIDDEEITSDEDDDEEIELGKKKREPYFDKETMEMLLSQITTKLEWINHLNVVTDVSQLEVPGISKDAAKDGVSTEIEDDFKREMLFYCQAQHAAKEALEKLRNMGVPTERPEDYFAEMVKSDTHMQKIRQKLVARKESMEKSEKAKKQRQFKKIGKKIQQEVLQKRQQEKKKMLNAVDQFKKGKKKRENDNNEDIFDVSATKGKQQELSIRGLKRKHKDEKFGFGGKKRKIRKNDAESSQDMSSYKRHIHGKPRGGNQNGNKKGSKGKRLGKSRRMKQGFGKKKKN
ncbi:probable rRNA-processing protein EBP2 isoform X1 [Hydra vulgaris]|uniref:Probable rRNA-processing protein EBP2 n=1 Tax=Hydra vulgaris TaxID=6087 RepID=T2M742_HYDVU|nr:probable rRNA-processing protein EBP2 [Hydra vulgaris]